MKDRFEAKDTEFGCGIYDNDKDYWFFFQGDYILKETLYQIAAALNCQDRAERELAEYSASSGEAAEAITYILRKILSEGAE